MELTDSLKTLFIETAVSLKGSDRRLFMAALSNSSAPAASDEPNASWAGTASPFEKACMNSTVASSVSMPFQLAAENGPKSTYPTCSMTCDIVDGQSQTDPQFRSKRLYTRFSATEVRRQLIAKKAIKTLNCPPHKPSLSNS